MMMPWWLRELSIDKLRRKVLPNLAYLSHSRIRKCGACGHLTVIAAMGRTEEFHLCLRCRANLRYEMLGTFLREAYPHIESLDVLELDNRSPLRIYLSRARSYTRSFFRPDVAAGTARPDGSICQDITRLSYADQSLDLIISSDVLEHVPDAAAAFRESARVLRPGGSHVFTVPPRAATRKRAFMEDGKVIHLLDPEYHLDPLDPNGILVFWDFGGDIGTVLATEGLRFALVEGPTGSEGRTVWAARRQ